MKALKILLAALIALLLIFALAACEPAEQPPAGDDDKTEQRPSEEPDDKPGKDEPGEDQPGEDQPEHKHTEEIIPAVEATCTESGWTEGKKCAECGEVLVERQMVESKGHTYGVWEIVQIPNCSSSGFREKVCSCGDSQSEEISANGEHGYIANVVAPTKTNDGYTEHICQYCDDSYTDSKTYATGSVGLEYTVSGEMCTITGIGTATDTELYIPAYIEGYRVSAIETKAFQENDVITKVVIAEGVVTIGARAFKGCTKLQEITIPASATNLGTQIIFDCDFLKTVYWNVSKRDMNNNLEVKSVEKIVFGGKKVASYVCSDNKYVKEVILTENVKEIESDAFANCTNLVSVSIEGNLDTIEGNAFWRCSKLENITITGVEEIEGSVFHSCASLTSIVLPNNLVKLGNLAFYNCTNLREVYLSNQLTKIEHSTFYGCSLLNNITIPDSVEAIYPSAFESCTSLTEITIPDSVTEIYSRAFARCEKLQFVSIPDSIEYISEGCFEYCNSLSAIVIPDSVREIRSYAFHGCSNLKSITVPSDVSVSYNGVFSGCNNLMNIYYNGTKEDWNADNTHWVDKIPADLVHCTDGDVAIQ